MENIFQRHPIIHKSTFPKILTISIICPSFKMMDKPFQLQRPKHAHGLAHHHNFSTTLKTLPVPGDAHSRFFIRMYSLRSISHHLLLRFINILFQQSLNLKHLKLDAAFLLGKLRITDKFFQNQPLGDENCFSKAPNDQSQIQFSPKY